MSSCLRASTPRLRDSSLRSAHAGHRHRTERPARAGPPGLEPGLGLLLTQGGSHAWGLATEAAPSSAVQSPGKVACRVWGGRQRRVRRGAVRCSLTQRPAPHCSTSRRNTLPCPRAQLTPRASRNPTAMLAAGESPQAAGAGCSSGHRLRRLKARKIHGPATQLTAEPTEHTRPGLRPEPRKCHAARGTSKGVRAPRRQGEGRLPGREGHRCPAAPGHGPDVQDWRTQPGDPQPRSRARPRTAKSHQERPGQRSPCSFPRTPPGEGSLARGDLRRPQLREGLPISDGKPRKPRGKLVTVDNQHPRERRWSALPMLGHRWQGAPYAKSSRESTRSCLAAKQEGPPGARNPGGPVPMQ